MQLADATALATRSFIAALTRYPSRSAEPSGERGETLEAARTAEAPPTSVPVQLEASPRSEPPAGGPSMKLFVAGTLVLYAVYGFVLYELATLVF